MSSTRNAGVYVDLAEPSHLPAQNRDYTSLKQQNNTAKKDRLMQPDLYEYDSDDEVAVYNWCPAHWIGFLWTPRINKNFDREKQYAVHP